MRAKHQRTKPAHRNDADALFLGGGVRAIARKTLPPGYTVVDLEQFRALVYSMFDEKEAKEIRVFDPFAQMQPRRVTVARLVDVLTQLIDKHTQQQSA